MLTFLFCSKLSKFFGLFSFLRKYLLGSASLAHNPHFSADNDTRGSTGPVSLLHIQSVKILQARAGVTHKRQSQSRMLSALSQGD